MDGSSPNDNDRNNNRSRRERKQSKQHQASATTANAEPARVATSFLYNENFPSLHEATSNPAASANVIFLNQVYIVL
jgi:hypothetical protein